MKNKFIQALPYILLSFILLFIYKNWFFVADIIGGDWPYYFPQTLSDFSFPPLSWVSWRGNGFGGIDITYALHIFEHFLALGSTMLHIPWNIISKIFWFGGTLLLMSWSSIYIYKTIFPKSNHWQRVTVALFYSINTYILLVASGGQMGYALGYAIAPLVCGLFIRSFSMTERLQKIRYSIITSLTLGFLLMVDIRITYMVLFVVGLYYLYVLSFIRKQILTTTIVFLAPIFLAGLLNLSWILPLVLLRQDIVSEVSQTYSSVESLRFFSFADFSHALGFLHPNWPENIFGKIYFMRWEFLILPLLALSSLLFISSKSRNDAESYAKLRKNILFFSMLGLIGAFLAKGVNEPFGAVYVWLFEHIPGFVMFRDPTKWYVLVSLAYSVLIPFAIFNIYSRLKLQQKFQISNFKFQINTNKKIFNLQNFFFLLTLFFLLFLVRPAFIGQLGGTFQRHTVPQEYTNLGEFIDRQPEFFRTMWFPRQSRFTYSTSEHRVIEALPFYEATSSAELVANINEPTTEQHLADIGVKYIIVPFDTFGDIFQKDRKYNHTEFEYVVRELRKITWLSEVSGFGKIVVFQTPAYRDHFYLQNGGEISYFMKNTTRYQLHVNTSGKDTLIFSENYNPYWIAKINNNSVYPIKTKDGYMQFSIPEKGTYDITVIFTQQYYYIAGFLISTVILLLLIVTFVVLQYKNFFHYLKNTL